jgi:hypothetical protein
VKVLITRRRWDWYFLGATVVILLGGLATALVIGDAILLRRLPVALLSVLPFWLVTRLLTPRSGMSVTTIRATQGAPQLLWWLPSTSRSSLSFSDRRHPWRASAFHPDPYEPGPAGH